MHLACPACAATYQVPDAMIGEGRQMRCVRCGESWFAGAREPTEVPVAVPDQLPLPTVIEPPAETPAPEAPKPPPRQTRGLLTLAWLGSLAAWAAALYVIWSQRDILTDLWPPIARLYALLGPA